jgi:Protein NO VEIN, C-terminal
MPGLKMPVVLSESEATESGIRYEDRTGLSYQFPKAYRRKVQPGERFVYYRGRRKIGGGTGPYVYFGTGIIGAVRPDLNHENRLTCDILDYQAFPSPVPFKDENARYLETGAARRGFFQSGVRTISQDDLAKILTAADAALPKDTAAPPNSLRNSSSQSYASPETIAAIEGFAVNVVLAELRSQYPGARVEIQPRNNPGFDILVVEREKLLYIEVKGTGRVTPQFFMTEGEIQFSHRHSASFRLLVVYAIDLRAQTYMVYRHDGAISEDTFALKPLQWACEVRTVS